ncbi:MAG: hypothetical protein IJ068_02665 [Bacilli bacterium]|nr:hypothetical protein [Bacilli bacterium]
MNELERRKIILSAIREAIANMKLENDFEDIFKDEEIVNQIEEKIKKIGGNNEKLGRLCS